MGDGRFIDIFLIISEPFLTGIHKKAPKQPVNINGVFTNCDKLLSTNCDKCFSLIVINSFH